MNGKKMVGAVLLIPLAIGVAGTLLFGGMFFLFMGTQQTEGTTVESSSPISAFGKSEIPVQYMEIYKAAADKYNVPWNLLAAVHRVETHFSTIAVMQSPVGAEGHMQFMPCTWVGWSHPSCSGLGQGNISKADKINPAVIAQYNGFGVDGNKDGAADPFNEVDAIFTAANYLARNGAADGDMRKAVFAYNHSEKYVSDVLGYMEKFAMPEFSTVEIVESSGGFARPLPTAVTSQFGQRFHPIFKTWRLHGGTDFDCATGDPIGASKPGIVSYAGWMDASNPKAGYGLYVWVEHGGGYKTGYNHLSSLTVKVGDQVNTGDIVGACGTTGTSTGPHLHFEIFKSGVLVDPAPYLGLY